MVCRHSLTFIIQMSNTFYIIGTSDIKHIIENCKTDVQIINRCLQTLILFHSDIHPILCRQQTLPKMVTHVDIGCNTNYSGFKKYDATVHRTLFTSDFQTIYQTWHHCFQTLTQLFYQIKQILRHCLSDVIHILWRLKTNCIPLHTDFNIGYNRCK